jgi:hypothetical protein
MSEMQKINANLNQNDECIEQTVTSHEFEGSAQENAPQAAFQRKFMIMILRDRMQKRNLGCLFLFRQSTNSSFFKIQRVAQSYPYIMLS